MVIKGCPGILNLHNSFIFAGMEWETYLEQKKINAAAYRKGNPEQYEEFEKYFLQLSPNSFTSQKLFLINRIRRQYPLVQAEPEKPAAKPAARPLFKPKPKTK